MQPPKVSESQKAEQAKEARQYDATLKRCIAEKNKAYCAKQGMPQWMLSGFKMNGTLQGRS